MAPPRLTVHSTWQSAPAEDLDGAVVVIDVLRATTSMIQAVAAGAESIVVVGEIDEAIRLAEGFGRESRLLCGERDGVKVPGFDLGNSPAEFTRERCDGKTLIWTTTNGSRAIRRAKGASTILLGGFVNLSALVGRLAKETAPVRLLCAGIMGRTALEDSLLAGAIVDALLARTPALADDAGRLVRAAYLRLRDDLAAAFEESEGGRLLTDLGFAGDLRLAAAVDSIPVVPEVDPSSSTIGSRAR